MSIQLDSPIEISHTVVEADEIRMVSQTMRVGYTRTRVGQTMEVDEETGEYVTKESISVRFLYIKGGVIVKVEERRATLAEMMKLMEAFPEGRATYKAGGYALGKIMGMIPQTLSVT